MCVVSFFGAPVARFACMWTESAMSQRGGRELSCSEAVAHAARNRELWRLEVVGAARAGRDGRWAAGVNRSGIGGGRGSWKDREVEREELRAWDAWWREQGERRLLCLRGRWGRRFVEHREWDVEEQRPRVCQQYRKFAALRIGRVVTDAWGEAMPVPWGADAIAGQGVGGAGILWDPSFVLAHPVLQRVVWETGETEEEEFCLVESSEEASSSLSGLSGWSVCS